jgi:hypothetical protein
MTAKLPLLRAQEELRINRSLYDAYYRNEDQCKEAEASAEQTSIELTKIMDRIRSKPDSIPPQDRLRGQYEMYRKQQLDLEPFISPLTLVKLQKIIDEFQELLISDKESSERTAFWSSSQMSMSSPVSSTSSTDACETTGGERMRALMRAEVDVLLDGADSVTALTFSTDVSSSSKSSVETASSPSSSSQMSSSSSSISSGSTYSTSISSSSTSAAKIASSMLESEKEIRGVESLITIPNSADLNQVVAGLVSEIPVTVGDTELVISIGGRIVFHRNMIPHIESNEYESGWVTSMRACKRVRVEVLLYALENALKAKDQTLIEECMDRIHSISRELDEEYHYERDLFPELKAFSLNFKEGIESHLKYIAEVEHAMYKQWDLD